MEFCRSVDRPWDRLSRFRAYAPAPGLVVISTAVLLELSILVGGGYRVTWY